MCFFHKVDVILTVVNSMRKNYKEIKKKVALPMKHRMIFIYNV